MRLLAGLALGFAALSCAGQDREIQRALIQRDQQSAEFAAQVRGAADRAALETLHAQQLRDVGRGLSSDPAAARQMQPYERQRMADERELRLSPPVILHRPEGPSPAPLPLPGGPLHAADPIPSQSPAN